MELVEDIDDGVVVRLSTLLSIWDGCKMDTSNQCVPSQYPPLLSVGINKQFGAEVTYHSIRYKYVFHGKFL